MSFLNIQRRNNAMPLYEYRCKKCGEVLEVLQKYDDQELSHCPYCKGDVERMISATMLVFKGPGFFCNDYRTKK